MRKYSEEWHCCNTLLAFMRGNDGPENVVRLVENYYKPYNNSAPANLLQQQIDKLQKILDDAVDDW